MDHAAEAGGVGENLAWVWARWKLMDHAAEAGGIHPSIFRARGRETDAPTRADFAVFRSLCLDFSLQ